MTTFAEELGELARSPELAAVRAKMEALMANHPADFVQRNDVSYSLGTLIRLQNEFPAPVEQPEG